MPLADSAPRHPADHEDEISSYVARAQAANLENVPALSAFQRRLARYPQLGPEQQAELVMVFQRGLRAKQRMAAGEVSARDERKLRREIHESEDAADRLIGSSWRLQLIIVRELAEKRYGRERAGELMGDLVGEANVAVVEAASNFDPSRGPSFSAYLARAVRDRVRMVLARQGADLRVSPSWSRVKRIATVRIPELQAELGRPPTKEDIQADLTARCLEWAEARLTPAQRDLPYPERHELMMAKLRKQGMLGAIRDIEEILSVTRNIQSLDAALGHDRSATLAETVAESDAGDTFDRVEHQELSAAITRALSNLTDRERHIIVRRFGLDGQEPWKYAQIAATFGVSAERIRQIEHAVMLKLADPDGPGRMLASFLPSSPD